MIKHILCIILTLTTFSRAQPTQWLSRGVGGGGALFNPSINPANDNEYYLACDMGDIFHSTDFGLSYEILPFMTGIEASPRSFVCMTNNPSVMYTLSSVNWHMMTVKTTNGGVSWAPLSGDPEPDEETFTMRCDYNNPNRVLIAYWTDVYFSSDGGATFNLIHTASSSDAGIHIAGVFFSGQNIFIGTNDGLLISTNGGSSFTMPALGGIPAAQGMFSFAGAKSGAVTRLFCLTGDKADIWGGKTGEDFWGFVRGVYSLDYGQANWVSKMNGIDVDADYVMFVGMAENNINTVYLGGGSDFYGYANIMKTTNAGANWTHVFKAVDNENIYTGWSGNHGDRDWGYGGNALGLTVAPLNANKVLFTDYGFVHKTSDGGATWYQAYVNPADQNPPGSATPRGRSYHGIGMENTSCWQVHWVDADNIFAAFTDIQGIRSTDGGQSWSFDYTGHDQNTMYRIAKHPGNGTLYAATSTIHDLYGSTRLQDNVIDDEDADGKIIYSGNGGEDWLLLHDFSHPVYWLALDPNNSNRMYASVVNHTDGLGGIYRCNDLQNLATSSWSKLPNPPRTEGHPAAIVVLNDGKVLCTYSGRRNSSGAFTASSGVFLYNPAGNSWTDVSHANMTYWCQDVVADPYDAAQNTWYVGVYSGWGGPSNDLGGLYRSTNRGQTWSRILTLHRVMSCTFHPHNQDILYLTTEIDGLYYSENIRATTPAFSQVAGYPFMHPSRVFFNPFKNGEIWVTSFGNGMRVAQEQSAVPPRLSLRVFLQGFYRVGGTMTTSLNSVLPLDSPYAAAPRHASAIPADVVDWIMLEFRTDPNNGASAFRSSFFLKSNGDVVDLDDATTELPLPGLTDGSYYVAVLHRNHLAAMSGTAVALNSTTIAVYDFTPAADRYYGLNGAVLLQSGLWGLWAGNANGDKFDTSLDYVMWFNARQQGLSGYQASDFDADQDVDSADFDLWKNNCSAGAESAVP